jgi:Zn-dependent protease
LDFLGSAVLEPLEIFFVKSVMINTVLAVFNMVPIPPLDGSRAVMSFFSLKHWELFYRFEMYGFLVIMVLLFTAFCKGSLHLPSFFFTVYF